MTKMLRTKRALAVVGLALLVMALNIGASILYMVVYSYVLVPGRDVAHYQAHAQLAAPWSSIVVGMLLMFLAGRWAAPRLGRGAALMIPIVYIAIDVLLVVGSGDVSSRLALLVACSYVTKLAAAWLGARTASTPQASSS